MKHRGATGVVGDYEFFTPRIRRGLLKACGALDPTPRVVLKQDWRLNRRAVDPEDQISDKVLANMRWDCEENNLRPRQIAKKYGMEDACARITRLMKYETRAHVMPVKPDGA